MDGILVSEEIIRNQVRRGVALLDEKVPGWVDRIDLEDLALWDTHACVAAQAVPDVEDYWEAKDVLGIGTGYEYGFTPDDDDKGLTDAEWRRVITERRAA